MKNKHVKTSKFLSLILRHKPQKIGLSLDPNGWVSVKALIKAANAHHHRLSQSLLEDVVATDNKQRYSFSPDGLRIRANQGHSINVDLDLLPVAPPEILYHGTVEKFLASIMESGLKKMGRQYVHLSETQETARSVGYRRGEPIILQIDAGRMHKHSHDFFLSENGVWLTGFVAPEYISHNAKGV